MQEGGRPVSMKLVALARHLFVTTCVTEVNANMETNAGSVTMLMSLLSPRRRAAALNATGLINEPGFCVSSSSLQTWEHVLREMIAPTLTIPPKDEIPATPARAAAKAVDKEIGNSVMK